ncbi:MAG: hypothetical protein GX442_07505 [Candidatus Riflebacteria bacterium]|nr:hypothetical protein [Candidatus Riflebacteria bacterium]
MLVRASRWMTVILLSLGLFFAGGELRKAEAGKGGHHHHKKVGFFKKMGRKIKRKIKRVCKKIRRGIVKAGCRVQNKIMDTGVKIKSKITGKRPKRVWVCGHYKKGNKHHTSGHWRRNRKHGKPGAGGGSNPGQGGMGQAPAPAPVPPTSISGGSPLPPIDPVLPSMSKQYKKRSTKAKRSRSRR